MMQGYSKEKAMEYLASCVHQADFPSLGAELPTLLSKCIDLEMAYMESAGVIDSEGYAADGEYDDDDAIEFIVERIISDGKYTPEQCADIAYLADEYLGYNAKYMEFAGLLSYE